MCSRDAHTSEGIYPVAKDNLKGSGSNKFCLVLVACAQLQTAQPPC
ncbi:MAG: hypothetical protein OJF51_001488 [Nitrospira sp.]|nr:MAG: hypothetical protein OJF51_001488 [Nitrospira sp.]